MKTKLRKLITFSALVAFICCVATIASAAERFINDYAVTVPTAIAAGDTVIVLKTGEGQRIVNSMIANPGDTIRLKLIGITSSGGAKQIEYLVVTLASANTLTVTRAQEGTVAWDYFPGSTLEYVLTAGAAASFSGGGGGGTPAADAGAISAGQGVRVQGGGTVNGQAITVDIPDGSITGWMLGLDASSLGSVGGDASITGSCVFPGPACTLEVATGGVQQGNIAANAVRGPQLGLDAGSLGTISGDAGVLGILSNCALPLTGTCLVQPNYGALPGTIAQGNDSRFSDSRAPTGAAGGVLGGTYPNPSLALDAGSLGTISGDAGTLGIMANCAIPFTGTCLVQPVYGSLAGSITQGNDSRLSDSRAPNGAAGGSLTGTYPNPGIGDASIAPSMFAASVYGAPTTLDGTGSNTTGTAGTVCHSDHIHGFPASISIDVTFAGAGTGLAVTNNMTVGGTILVTGNATLNGANTLGQVSVPAMPTGTNLKISNVAVANNAVPYFQNATYSFAGGFCPFGALGEWGMIPLGSGASAAAGGDLANSIYGHQQRCVAGGGGCTLPAATGSTLQTRAPHMHMLSAATTGASFGDIYTSAAGVGDPVVHPADGFIYLSVWSETTNQAQENVAIGLFVVWNGGVDSVATREGVSFNFNTNVSSQTGNYQFTTAVGNPLATFTQTDLGNSFPRSLVNVYQGLIFAAPAATGIGYQVCDITTPGIGTVATCVRGVQTTNLPTSALVKESYCQHNRASVDGGTGLDGAATNAAACAHEVYLEKGCGGSFGIQ